MKIVCINKNDYSYLTDGKIYEVIGITNYGYIITNDDNEHFNYEKYLFEEIIKIESEDNKMTKNFKEVIADIKEGEVWEREDKKWNIKLISILGGTVKVEVEDNRPEFYFSDERIYTLQRKKVSFTEAFKAYEEGKEIESCVSCCRFKRQRFPYENKIQDSVYNEKVNKFVPITKGYGFEINEIEGQWYINN